MQAATLASIWLAMAGFVAGEYGRRSLHRTGIAPPWAWPAWCAGLLLCIVHILLAMASRHHWSHASALVETAQQTAAVYGLSWGGGLYVNYAFVGVWLVELLRWRFATSRVVRQPAWVTWAVRGFFLTIVVNATVIFAAATRRVAGLVLCGALVASWTYPEEDRSSGDQEGNRRSGDQEDKTEIRRSGGQNRRSGDQEDSSETVDSSVDAAWTTFTEPDGPTPDLLISDL